jgi:copper chaperone CopZ
MTETKIYVPDIECESCSKLISRKFKDNKEVHSVKVNEDSVDIKHDDALKPETMIKTIKSIGFRASLQPFDRKNLNERLRDFNENKKKYTIELASLRYSLYIFLILTLLESVAYFGFFRYFPGFVSNYVIWLFYINLSIATIGSAVWHYLAYKVRVTCMTGMMIGMTIGMQTGMMIGSVIGAVNGFFVGAMTGMILGVVAGALTGKCCGIMGILQGMMAGMMGGTMGPMISIMMFSDNLLLFMPFYIAINVFILWGFSYMVLEEMGEGKNAEKKPIDFMTFASVCIIITFALVMIMLYGPKSFLIR